MTKSSDPPQARPFLVIAITGSIGSGKSSVAHEFERLGAPVVSADDVARQVVAPGTPALAEIRMAFGRHVLTAAGTLDRKRLGRLIFSDPAKRAQLEQITHPRIRAQAQKLLTRAARSLPNLPRPSTHERHLIVYEVPLFFESQNRYPMVDYVVVVDAPRAQLISRVVGRDGLSRNDVVARLNAQLHPKRKRELADLVITNNGSQTDLLAATRAAYDLLRRLPPRAPEPLVLPTGKAYRARLR